MPCRNLEESDASMRQRLVNSLSQSFPGSALSKALQCINDDEEEMKDPLSSSCFAELRLDKEVPDEDDELTSLAWLQDSNLLKDINAGEDEAMKENGDIKLEPGYAQTHPSHVPYNPHKHINSKPPYSFSCLIFMALEESPTKMLPVKDIYQWILSHFPYFQNAPTGWKNSVRHNLSLNKCFKKVDKDRGHQTIGKGSLWCVDPDYRPNLLQALRKTPYHPYHQLQMLANPPPSQQNHYQLYGLKPQPLAPRLGPNSISPHLFPFLSRRLGQSHLDIDSDIKDVAQTLVSLKSWSKAKADNASFAQGLKRKLGEMKSPTKRVIPRGPVICTDNPSEDHTYSITRVEADEDEYVPGSPGSSIDDEYDFGSDDDVEDEFSDADVDDLTERARKRDNLDSEGESGVDEVDGCISNNNNLRTSKRARLLENAKRHRFAETTEEEKKKIEEGADALLNLAGICLSRAHTFNREIVTEKLDGTKEYPEDIDSASDCSSSSS